MGTTTVTYLVDELRLHLGDIDPASYQYLDAWLEVSLLTAVKSLQKWWKYRYLVDSSNLVYRNSAVVFNFTEPPVIETSDERPIILMAAVIIKGGTLQNSAWNTGSWRDAEISYSNIEGSRLRQESLKADWDELLSILKPPQKVLLGAKKATLPGYKNNQWEVND